MQSHAIKKRLEIRVRTNHTQSHAIKKRLQIRVRTNHTQSHAIKKRLEIRGRMPSRTIGCAVRGNHTQSRSDLSKRRRESLLLTR